MIMQTQPMTASDAFSSPVVAYLAMGVLTIALFHKRWPTQWDGFTKGSLKGAAFIAGFWPLALLWLAVLEVRHGLWGRPEPAWPSDRRVISVRPAKRKESVPLTPTRDAEVEERFARLSPPKELRSGAAWDEYWKHHLNSGFAFLADMMCNDEALVAHMRERGLSTVLLAGNGVSLEVRALASAGFVVTALDISPLAMRVAGEMEPPPEPLAMMVGAGASSR